MTRPRFEFALERVKPTQWESFEELASVFLADEYPQLRRVAGTGDGGRDAVLWQPTDDPSVVLQFSIRQDWEQKVMETAVKVCERNSDVQVLIYVTNQHIGPSADRRRSQVRKEHHLYLDVRDRTWLLDRQNRSRATATAAEEFAAPIVEPILASNAVIDQTAGALEVSEARAALVFLAMQWEDDSRDKGLTKLSFEALALAALRETNNDTRLSRHTVRHRVRCAIRGHKPEAVEQYTDLALDRLARKQRIRHWKKEDEFCLSFEERRRRTDALIKFMLLVATLDWEIKSILLRVSNALDLAIQCERLEQLQGDVRRILEVFLLRKGEAFVHSLAVQDALFYTEEEVEAICNDNIKDLSKEGLPAHNAIRLVSATITELLVRPSRSTQRYLRVLADGYTLFAFLRQMPDAQGAVRKIFSNARIWLDTSALLPVLAEVLLEDEEKRSYTRVLRAAGRAGMKLYVTPGVIRELYFHIRHARYCQESWYTWQKRVPFLLEAYLLRGRPMFDFKTWTEEFIGVYQPLQDIADFLHDVAGLTRVSLQNEVEKADEQLYSSVVRYWKDVHYGRSQAVDAGREPEVAETLAEHDVENFLGIIMARKGEVPVNSLGYEHWWLTLDRRAYHAASEICQRNNLEPFDSPIMSYDFLINYVAVGPRRADVSKDEERLLPLMLDMSFLDGIPKEILEIAEATRSEMADKSERLIRREVRDKLNAARLRSGPIAKAGLDVVEGDFRTVFDVPSD